MSTNSKPKYVDKILKKLASEKPKTPGVHHVRVLHDPWCAFFDDKPCNCEPEIETGEEGGQK